MIHPGARDVVRKCGGLNVFLACDPSLKILEDPYLRVVYTGCLASATKASPKSVTTTQLTPIFVAEQLNRFIFDNGYKKNIWRYQIYTFYAYLPGSEDCIEKVGGLVKV